MDKSWIKIADRTNKKYIDGVDMFLNWAFSQQGVSHYVRCPCKNCKIANIKNKSDIRADLLAFGFLESYEKWIYHGEELSELPPKSNASKKKKARVNNETQKDNVNEKSRIEGQSSQPKPGKISELQFLVKLLNLKNEYKWSDSSIDEVLQIVKGDMLPHSTLIPTTYSEALKITQMVDGIKEEVRAEVKAELRENVKAELRDQVQEEVRAQVQSELQAHMASFLSKGGSSSGNHNANRP